jgi:hypothetical protein
MRDPGAPAVDLAARFDREQWEDVLRDFLRASENDPMLLTRFDMVGNSLQRDVDPRTEDCLKPGTCWGSCAFNRMAAHYLKWPISDEYGFTTTSREAVRFREEIKPVGCEDDWKQAVKSSHQKPVPFDEPVLGIVWMWRFGDGPNPHLALALGETMLRVGQRYIAWCAYERAVLLSDRFSPDPKIVSRLVAHGRERQARIEETLPAEEREALRPRFEKELAFGRRYQAAYQEYEEKKIREGADIDDPDFYDAFEKEHGPIVSRVGREDVFLAENYRWSVSWDALLYAGLFAFGAASLWRLLFSGIRRRWPDQPPSPPPAVPPSDAITV